MELLNSTVSTGPCTKDSSTGHDGRHSYNANLGRATTSAHKGGQFSSHTARSGTVSSFSKVLFIIPSWYLYTIGLKHISSFARHAPPNLHFMLKKCDSHDVHR